MHVPTCCVWASLTHSACSRTAAAGAGLLGLFQGRFARPLAVGTSLMFFQQVTGQPSVLYYASEIFEDAGFAAGAEANGISVILGVFKLIMTGAPPF